MWFEGESGRGVGRAVVINRAGDGGVWGIGVSIFQWVCQVNEGPCMDMGYL